MAALINNDITTAGLLVLAKGQAGAPIRFTRIVLGDGYLPTGTIPRNMLSVVSPVVSLPISKCRVNGDGTVTVGAVFTNEQLVNSFDYRELGLYAEDADLGEVLYCYGNAGEYAEHIIPGGGSTIIEKLVDIITIIGNAVYVTAYIASELYATKDDLAGVTAIAFGVLDTANDAKDIALQALKLSHDVQETTDTLQIQVGENSTKISTLWDAVFSDITGNPFLVTFADLDGIILTEGIWNNTLHRIEC